MKLSPEILVRFVLNYSQDLSGPLQIILGYGYLDAGRAHAEIAEFYFGIGQVACKNLYAGYFYLDKGEVCVLGGGSQSLGIRGDKAKDDELVSFLKRNGRINQAVISLITVILRREVSHTMMFVG